MKQTNATAELLRSMHDQLAEELFRRVRSGEATPAELREARQFLKDNGIEAIHNSNSPLLKIANSLPEFDEGEVA